MLDEVGVNQYLAFLHARPRSAKSSNRLRQLLNIAHSAVGALPVPWSSSRSRWARRRLTSGNEAGPKSHTGLPRAASQTTTRPRPRYRPGRDTRSAARNFENSAHPAVRVARGWNTLLSVHSRSKITESLRATPTRALAAEARLASLRPQSFRSEVAFDRVNSPPAASTR